MNNVITLYKNHGGTIGAWEGSTSGAWVHSRACKVLGGKWVEAKYQAKPMNVGRSNATTGAEQAILELASKARLKIDKGYVHTIEEASKPSTNGLGLLKPMLATPLDKVKPESIDWYTAYAQPKLDGHRALYDDGVLYSRQGKVLHMPHIVEAIEASGLSHLHLDGELYIHGMALQHVSRLIKKHTKESLQVEYHIYDMISDLPFLQRIQELTKSDFIMAEGIRLVDTCGVTDMEHLMEYHHRFREDGYEGTMLRFGTEGYQSDKRSRSLLKIKSFHDAEFEVIGVVAGKPRFSDENEYQVPVWICKTHTGAEFNVTAHGDMIQKDDQWVNRKEHIGQMLTIKYHYLSQDGIPQLPIALRWYETV